MNWKSRHLSEERWGNKIYAKTPFYDGVFFEIIQNFLCTND